MANRHAHFSDLSAAPGAAATAAEHNNGDYVEMAEPGARTAPRHHLPVITPPPALLPATHEIRNGGNGPHAGEPAPATRPVGGAVPTSGAAFAATVCKGGPAAPSSDATIVVIFADRPLPVTRNRDANGAIGVGLSGAAAMSDVTGADEVSSVVLNADAEVVARETIANAAASGSSTRKLVPRGGLDVKLPWIARNPINFAGRQIRRVGEALIVLPIRTIGQVSGFIPTEAGAPVPKGGYRTKSTATAYVTDVGPQGLIVNLAGSSSSIFLSLGGGFDEVERERLMAFLDDRYLTWRHRWMCISENRPHRGDESTMALFNFVSIVVVFFSILIYCMQTLPQFFNDGASLADPLFLAECACMAFFISEAVFRVYCVPLSHLFTSYFIIDLLTIFGFAADFLPSITGGGVDMGFLNTLRLLRVARILKIARYSQGMQIANKVFARSAGNLLMLLMPFVVIVLTAATFVYFAEVANARWDSINRRWVDAKQRPLVFQSIFDGFWFTMTTITTTGYGDYVPQSLWGKVVAGFVAIFGVLTLSFPNVVLGGHMSYAIRKHARMNARQRLGMRFRKVLMCVMFYRRMRAHLEAKVMADYLQSHHDALRAGRFGHQLHDSDADEPLLTMAAAARHNSMLLDRGNSFIGRQTTMDIIQHGLMTPAVDGSHGHFPAVVPASGTQHPLPRISSAYVEHCRTRTGKRGAAGVDAATRRTVFTLFDEDDFELECSTRLTPVTRDNVRTWSFRGVNCIDLLRVLLEGYSGVSTVEELYRVWPGGLTIEDDEDHEGVDDDMLPHIQMTEGLALRTLAQVILFLGRSGYLSVFCMRRGTVLMVASLTTKAVHELLVNPQLGMIRCQRSLECARFIWKMTTGHLAPYPSTILKNTYTVWAVCEKYAGMFLSSMPVVVPEGATAAVVSALEALGPWDELQQQQEANANAVVIRHPDLKFQIELTSAERHELRRIHQIRSGNLNLLIPDVEAFLTQAEVMRRTVRERRRQRRLIQEQISGQAAALEETIRGLGNTIRGNDDDDAAGTDVEGDTQSRLVTRQSGGGSFSGFSQTARSGGHAAPPASAQNGPFPSSPPLGASAAHDAGGTSMTSMTPGAAEAATSATAGPATGGSVGSVSVPTVTAAHAGSAMPPAALDVLAAAVRAGSPSHGIALALPSAAAGAVGLADAAATEVHAMAAHGLGNTGQGQLAASAVPRGDFSRAALVQRRREVQTRLILRQVDAQKELLARLSASAVL